MNKYLLIAGTILLSAQANASTQDLIDAVKNNNFSVVKQLISQGENINGVNDQGNSALHYAVALDNADIAKFLLQNGANMNLSNDKGWTPLKIAEKKNVQNVTAVLAEELQKEQAEANKMAIEQEASRVKALKKEQEKLTKSEQKQSIDTKSEIYEEQSLSDEELAEILVQKLNNAVEEAQTARKEAIAAQNRAETAAKILEDKVKELQLSSLPKIPVKSNVKSADKKNEPLKKTIKSMPKKIVKPAPTPDSKPKQKPVILIKSSMVEGIYAGDEEIVYCMNILGQGENHYMVTASGYYASSVGIKEVRYNQIIDLANKFYTSASNDDLSKQVAKCSKIVTPDDKIKQNIIIRSINSSIGY